MNTEDRLLLEKRLKTLEESIYSGVRKVKYDDMETEYRSLSEMKKLADDIRAVLDPEWGRQKNNLQKIKTYNPSFDSGY